MSRLAVFAVIAACGHAGGSSEPDSSTSDAASDPRAAAAETTATTNSLCTKIAPFYWEIGDAGGAIASGSTGDGGVKADTTMKIASASKLVFAAYVVEKYKADLSQADYAAMTMRSGYASLTYESCVSATTVDDCLAKNNNGKQTLADVNRFDYNGGHFQHYASAGLGLGADDDVALAAAMGFPYASPQLAAGIATTPSAYAAFLREILTGQRAIHDHLTDDPVCTLASATCDAIYSPSPYAWHYSWGHWIEDDPAAGDDGAFSSPGAFGFYPWIDASRTYYGVLARDDEKLADATTAYKDSVYCGRVIRKAFLTGTPQ